MTDWLDGLACLLSGRDWHGPAYRAAKAEFDAEREAGANLQEQMAVLGVAVSLETCRDAARDGYAERMLAVAKDRGTR